jgi:exoribonuclease R
MSFKLHVADRKYESFDITNLSKDIPSFNPIEHKLLNQDTFDYDHETNTVSIKHSVMRQSIIPGVLVLEGNKRYGKYKRRFLYKCVPDDRSLPIFMVPYLIRLGFNKRLYNKYVLFQFNNWDSKHPLGLLEQTLGDVTNISMFYEYQLYCKSIYASIQDFNRTTMRTLKKTTELELTERIREHDMEDRREWDIISIDPKNSKDFDDAFGIKELDNKFMVSIYIANVSFWLEALQLWNSFSQRVSTIYLL